MSTADRALLAPDAAPDPEFGACRFSCPADLMRDDLEADPRTRRSTLARLFGVRPQPMPEPKPVRTDMSMSTHRMLPSAAPLVSARERDASTSSPRAIPWQYPTSVQPRSMHVQAFAQAKQTETEVEALPNPELDLDRKPESTSTNNSPARSPVGGSPGQRHLQSTSRSSFSTTNATSHRNGITEATMHGVGVGVGDDVVTMHDQIRLLMLNLEEEKKRRASEQQLMQQRILELQSVIRRNFPEQQRALERRVQNNALSSSLNSSLSSRGSAAHPRVRLTRSARTASFKNVKAERRRERVASSEDLTDDEASESDKLDAAQAQGQGEDNQTDGQAQAQGQTQGGDVIDATDRADETRRRQQLNKLRSKMKAMVVEAQQEARTLKLQMVEERRSYEKRERQLRSESIVHLASLEEKHLHTQHQLTKTVESLTMQVETLSEEKRRMQEELEAKDARIRELELALQGKAVVQGQSTA